MTPKRTEADARQAHRYNHAAGLASSVASIRRAPTNAQAAGRCDPVAPIQSEGEHGVVSRSARETAVIDVSRYLLSRQTGRRYATVDIPDRRETP